MTGLVFFHESKERRKVILASGRSAVRLGAQRLCQGEHPSPKSPTCVVYSSNAPARAMQPMSKFFGSKPLNRLLVQNFKPGHDVASNPGITPM